MGDILERRMPEGEEGLEAAVTDGEGLVGVDLEAARTGCWSEISAADEDLGPDGQDAGHALFSGP